MFSGSVVDTPSNRKVAPIDQAVKLWPSERRPIEVRRTIWSKLIVSISPVVMLSSLVLPVRW